MHTQELTDFRKNVAVRRENKRERERERKRERERETILSSLAKWWFAKNTVVYPSGLKNNVKWVSEASAPSYIFNCLADKYADDSLDESYVRTCTIRESKTLDDALRASSPTWASLANFVASRMKIVYIVLYSCLNTECNSGATTRHGQGLYRSEFLPRSRSVGLRSYESSEYIRVLVFEGT